MIEAARYDLPEPEAAALLAQLFSDDVVRLPKDGLICLQLSGASPYANLARRVEAEVFLADLGDPWQVLAAEFGPFESYSTCFLVLDCGRRATLGATRMVRCGPEGTPTLRAIGQPPHCVRPEEFFGYYGATPERTCEAGSLAINPQHRARASSPTVGALLFRSAYASWLTQGIEHVIGFMRPEALNRVREVGFPCQDMMNLPLKVFPDGSSYQPVMLRVADCDARFRQRQREIQEAAKDEQQRRKASALTELIEAIRTGTGLDPMIQTWPGLGSAGDIP